MLMKNVEGSAEKIMNAVGMKNGIIPGFELFGNRVLVGVYTRSAVTKSGIHLPDQTLREDEHQGKAAIVLMKGPTAFVSDSNFDFCGQTLEVGDWVMSFVSVGIKCVVNGQLCRIVRDQDITMRIPQPDQVY
jgi:co-chaperonin GroES (HSP10)